mgnify:CR=1 FL=1
MGKLIDGEWVKTSIITSDESGAYKRLPRTFLETVSENHAVFKPETDRYHLYVSLACPWASRALIYRELKELQNHISVDIVHPDMLEDGWKFDPSFPGATKDSIYDYEFLRQIYQKADPKITTSVTVPILWDKHTETIVNNESSQIIRIMNSAFNSLTNNHDDYYPQTLSKKNMDKKLHILADVKNEIKKTKEFNKFLVTNKLKNVVIISDKISLENIYTSARNIKDLKVINEAGANIYDMLKYKNVLLTLSSIKSLEKRIFDEKN